MAERYYNPFQGMDLSVPDEFRDTFGRYCMTGGRASISDGDLEVAQEMVDERAKNVNLRRAQIGGDQRGLEAVEVVNDDMEIIHRETLSQIEDTDYAVETTRFAQADILVEAAIMALAFLTREQGEEALTLIENVAETGERLRAAAGE